MKWIGMADDHPVIMDALESTLTETRAFAVAFKVRTGEQLLEALRTQHCDFAITDYSMTQGAPGGDGLALIERVLRQFPHVKLIVFTMLSNPALCGQLAKLGVHGIVSKNDERGEILAALRAIEAGHAAPYCSPSVRGWLAAQPSGNAANNLQPTLSQREVDVVRLFAQGETLDEIAGNLKRAKSTVATHKQNAMQKLGITNNADLICYAYEIGIV
ncbi:response regulator transcription factor [Paraburkholderia bonniea]|uniref:response regulator transcription factor n=1 Tax=Paraburkholderia bonniea TaxID=2152891 RepID=UPI001290F1A5|nr:response regulator transcription factor [Paraburkholderia bonniea]WJF89840.1 response regulator transcription factor [Paraburkholderia bonniea]WJF93154.1 response regulator transcription factor [Paraburkholderia bonniea]